MCFYILSELIKGTGANWHRRKRTCFISGGEPAKVVRGDFAIR